jgi:hypothetical protein
MCRYAFDPSNRKASHICRYVLTGVESTNMQRNQFKEKIEMSIP